MILRVNEYEINAIDLEEGLRSVRAFLPDLEDFRGWALSYLNIWRGRARAELGLTQADFQDLVYSGKLIQAQRWLDDQNRQFFFHFEAVARGISDQSMAELIVAQGAAWLDASDQIEGAYISAKAGIESAQDEAAITAILTSL